MCLLVNDNISFWKPKNEIEADKYFLHTQNEINTGTPYTGLSSL